MYFLSFVQNLSALWPFLSWFNLFISSLENTLALRKQETDVSGHRKFSCREVITFLKAILIFLHLGATSSIQVACSFHQVWP